MLILVLALYPVAAINGANGLMNGMAVFPEPLVQLFL